MEKNKQKQAPARRVKEDFPILNKYTDWRISTWAKCDCNWSSCLKKIFNDHNKKEIITLRNYLYIQSHLPMKERNPFDPDLQFLVGVAYLCGWLPCKDNVEEARCWFQRSADLGSAPGMMAMGYLNEKHLGKYHDENDMIAWYSMAGDRGYFPAKRRLTSYQQQQLKEIKQDTEKSQKASEKAQKAAETAQDTSTKNNEILRRVELSVQMLQSSLNTMWTEMQAVEEEFREQLQKLQWGITENLNKVPKVELEEAERFMSVLFKDDWRNPGRLCNESCDALVTAHVLMKMADMLEIRNYAGIVITAVWALEYECRRRFQDSFNRYLASINIPEGERAFRMNIKPGRDGSPQYTLGSISCVVNSPDFDVFSKATGLLSPIAEKERTKKGYSDAQMVWKYWLPGTRDSVSKKGKSLQSMIMMLNNDYRIPAAHAMEVSRKKAEECCDLLGITETHKKQAELAEASKKMDNITGALKALLWLTAPLEQKG